MNRWTLAIPLAALTALCFTAPAARAVVIAPSFDNVNLVAPVDDPGWNHVGRVRGGSGIYLGNRWVLTAAHVGQGDFRLADGRWMTATIGSQIQLHNAGLPASAGRPDLLLFRLVEDPGLAGMTLSSASPAAGTRLTMIGAGKNKNPAPQGWRAVPTVNGTTWTEESLPNSNHVGYHLLDSSQMRWGVNHVGTATSFQSDEKTWAYETRFDQVGTTFEAQAVPGDSGGGVFMQVDSQWQLSGVMLAIQLFEDQPADTVMYGNDSTIADLSVYRDEILELMSRPDSPWQNQVNHYDVGRNGTVTSRDVLQIIDELMVVGPYDLIDAPTAADPRLDVNGDLKFGPSDLSSLISFLINDNQAQPLSLASGVAFVPEPSSGILAALAAAGLWIAYRRRSRAH